MTTHILSRMPHIIHDLGGIKESLLHTICSFEKSNWVCYYIDVLWIELHVTRLGTIWNKGTYRRRKWVGLTKNGIYKKRWLNIQEKTLTRLDTSKDHGMLTFDIMDNYQYIGIAKGHGLVNSWMQCYYGICTYLLLLPNSKSNMCSHRMNHT